MVRVHMPAKVLAVFEPGKCPVPYKVKVRDNRNNEILMYIDVIRNIDTRSFNSILYDCVSISGDREKQFQLIYYIGKYQWYLFGI